MSEKPKPPVLEIMDLSLETNQRYFSEAIDIASEKCGGRVRPVHLKALYAAFVTLSLAHEKVTGLMQNAIAEVQKRRIAQGLPPLPPPPGELSAFLKQALPKPELVKTEGKAP